jgi:DNA gyrase/topoisomerase IV subunit A
MRYTEAKMTKITLELLRDINKDTIDFLDNYDGTLLRYNALPQHRHHPLNQSYLDHQQEDNDS